MRKGRAREDGDEEAEEGGEGRGEAGGRELSAAAATDALFACSRASREGSLCGEDAPLSEEDIGLVETGAEVGLAECETEEGAAVSEALTPSTAADMA